MNYTFPINKKELLLTSGLSILWQSIDLDEESKLIKDNQKSLQIALTMLNRESQTSYTELRRIITAFIPLQNRRISASKTQESTSASKPASNASASPTQPKQSNKSAKKQLQAIASRLSTVMSGSPRTSEPRRATVPQTNVTRSVSPQHRAGSTVSLSSTRSAPVIIASSPNQLVRTNTTNSNQSINLDYFPFDDEHQPSTSPHQTSASSSTMLPPKKPSSLHHMSSSPNIANASWDNLLYSNPSYNNANTNLNNDLFNPLNMPAVHTPMSMSNSMLANDWISTPDHNGNWNLPTMDFSTKAPVPQSLLSFSGESITSGDDFLFSASSNNGSTNTNDSSGIGNGNGNGGRSGRASAAPMGEQSGAFKGIAMPAVGDDEFDFEALEG